MRMLSKFIAASGFSALVLVSPAHAGETAKRRFTHDNYTYVYDVKDTRTGQVISGRRFPDAAAFSLSVRNGKVQGISNDQRVAFTLEDARGAAE